MLKRSRSPGILTWLTLLFFYFPIVLLVIFGVRKSTPGPNRYGEAPVRF